MRRTISNMTEMLQRLADGDTIRYSQDGDMAWFTDGDRAFVAEAPIIKARSAGYLDRRCSGDENYRGMSEYDTISDKGRIAIAAATGGSGRMRTQREFVESVAEAALSTVLKGIDPDTGRAISHKRTAELLNKVADMHPEAIRAEITRLCKIIALLTDYLPQEGAGE